MSEISPVAIPKTMSCDEKEWFCLFAVAVAGKSTKQTEAKMRDYFDLGDSEQQKQWSPFEIVQIDTETGRLGANLRAIRFGQYTRIEKAWSALCKLDVDKDLTVEKLESIHGIGPKTARFIIFYTDPISDVVPLDTHILKYLAKYGEDNELEFKVPKSTPSAGKKYNYLESVFQGIAKSQGKTVRELDTEVWKSYSKYGD